MGALSAGHGPVKTSPSPGQRSSTLLKVPRELICEIAEHITLDDDLSRLVRTCHYMFTLLNSKLYKRNSRQDNFAILWAAKTGSEATLKVALENGANASVKSSDFITLVMGISRRRRSPTFGLIQVCNDMSGKTPLILAAERGDTNVIRLLLQQPHLNAAATASDMTAVHWAAWNGHAPALQLLLTHSTLNTNQDSLGRTPLILAASRGHLEVVSELLRRCDVQLNATDPYGFTALHWASKKGYEVVVEALLGHDGTDVNARDFRGYTALHLAIKNRRMPTIGILARHRRTDVSARDRHGFMPIHLIAKMHLQKLLPRRHK